MTPIIGEPEPDSGINIVLGAWEKVGFQPDINHFSEEGGWRWGHSVDEIEAKLEGAPDGVVQFEGMQMTFVEDPQCGDRTGIYEVALLENGNLKFTKIEDECLARGNWFQSPSGIIEWEKVE